MSMEKRRTICRRAGAARAKKPAKKGAPEWKDGEEHVRSSPFCDLERPKTRSLERYILACGARCACGRAAPSLSPKRRPRDLHRPFPTSTVDAALFLRFRAPDLRQPPKPPYRHALFLPNLFQFDNGDSSLRLMAAPKDAQPTDCSCIMFAPRRRRLSAAPKWRSRLNFYHSGRMFALGRLGFRRLSRQKSRKTRRNRA